MRCLAKNPRVAWEQILNMLRINHGEVNINKLSPEQKEEFTRLLFGYLPTLNEVEWVDPKSSPLSVPYCHYFVKDSFESYFRYRKIKMRSCCLSKIFDASTDCISITGEFDYK